MQKIAKRAIEAALNSNWQEAADLNLQILKDYPENTDTKNRLAKAYIQLGQWAEAKKYLKEVLKVDPINQVAKKNLRIAENKAIIKNENSKQIDAENFVKEPGISYEVNVDIKKVKKTIDDFEIGEVLELKVKKSIIEVYSTSLKKVLGEIENEKLASVLSKAKKEGISFTANLVGGKASLVEVLIRADKAIFKSQKQDIRPYVKKGAIEEPEIEIPENEMTGIE